MNILKFRKAMGLNQEQFAVVVSAMAGRKKPLSRAQISMWETGARHPGAAMRLRLIPHVAMTMARKIKDDPDMSVEDIRNLIVAFMCDDQGLLHRHG